MQRRSVTIFCKSEADSEVEAEVLRFWRQQTIVLFVVQSAVQLALSPCQLASHRNDRIFSSNIGSNYRFIEHLTGSQLLTLRVEARGDVSSYSRERSQGKQRWKMKYECACEWEWNIRRRVNNKWPALTMGALSSCALASTSLLTSSLLSSAFTGKWSERWIRERRCWLCGTKRLTKVYYASLQGLSS